MEVPFGDANHLFVDAFLDYEWSAVNIKYNILNQGLDAGLTPSKPFFLFRFYLSPNIVVMLASVGFRLSWTTTT